MQRPDVVKSLIGLFALRPGAAPTCDPRSRPTYMLLAIFLVAVTATYLSSDFVLRGAEWGMVAILLSLQVLLGMCFRARGLAALATAVEASALLTVICITAVVATILLGASRLPTIDEALMRADQVLWPGLDWPATMIAFSKHTTLMAIANAAYETLSWQPAMLLLLLCLTGASHRCWTFVCAWLITLMLVVFIYAFTPTFGAYPFHGITAAEMPGITDPNAWRYLEILHSLRSGALRVITFDRLEGLVTFPSFHAGAAILLGWGYWALRWARWPFAALNCAMFLSAVPIGGHYFVDLLAGSAVAAFGISAANLMSVDNRRRPAAPDAVLGATVQS